MSQSTISQVIEMGFTRSQIDRAIKELGAHPTKLMIIEQIIKQQPNDEEENKSKQAQEGSSEKSNTANQIVSDHNKKENNNSNTNNNNNNANSTNDKSNEKNSYLNKIKNDTTNSWLDVKWPRDPLEKNRIEGIPTGLLNVGNTCYVNSMIQSYFMLPQFREHILNFKPTQFQFLKIIEKFQEQNENNISNDSTLHLKMIHELQRLFGAMISSNLRFVNPKKAIKMLFNENEEDFFRFGQQNDVLEFHDYFCQKIEDGINFVAQLNQQKQEQNNSQIIIEKDQENSKEILQNNSNNKNKNNGDNKNDSLGNKIQKEEQNEKDTKKEKETQTKKETETETEKEKETETEKEKEGLIDPNENASIDNNTNEINKKKDQEKETWMSDLFYGESVISIQGTDEKNKKFELINHEKLGRIILSIEYGDLYSSLDSYTLEEGIKYKLTSKYKTTVSKELGFEKLPKILIFQLQRVIFDKKTLRTRKNNQPFKFDKELFLDHYMYKNHQRRKQSRKRLKNLKNEKKKLKQELKQLKNYKNSNMPIQLSLNHVEKYFINIDKELDPDFNFLKEENKQHIKLEIQKIFVVEKIVGYTIHSVLIHRGIAGSGHYFSFVYGSKKNIWYKFNDRQVSIISEEEVMKDSIGEKNNTANAYCLIYVESDFNKNTLIDSIQLHQKIIPKEIQEEINYHNNNFEREIKQAESIKYEEKMKAKAIEFKNEMNNIFNNILDSIQSNNIIENALSLKIC